MTGHRGWAGVLLAGFTLGCGGNGPFPVEGTVLLDGQPVEGATVQFEPAGKGGQGAMALTGPDGRFSLATALGTGAMRGEYRVIIGKVTGPEIPGNPPPMNASPAELARWQRAGIDAMKAQKSEVPYIYGTFADTPLRCAVPTSGRVVFDLDKSRFADKPYVYPGLDRLLKR
jgi:hypothetical protein